jgi:hypothetical protein
MLVVGLGVVFLEDLILLRPEVAVLGGIPIQQGGQLQTTPVGVAVLVDLLAVVAKGDREDRELLF